MSRDYTPTEAHKEAMAQGREEARAVREYLKWLENPPPPDPDAIEDQVEALQRRIEDETNPLQRVQLIQRRMDLEDEKALAESAPDQTEVERAFVKAVPGYTERKGLTYKAWREVGVPAAVLKEAGLR